jgi:hypothetical protein
MNEFVLYIKKFPDGHLAYYALREDFVCALCHLPVNDDIVKVVFSWRKKLPSVREVLHASCFSRGHDGKKYSEPLLTATQNANNVIVCDNIPAGCTPRAFFPPEFAARRGGDLSVFDVGGIEASYGSAPGDEAQYRKLRAGRPEYTALDDDAPVVLGDRDAARRILEKDRAVLSTDQGLAFLDTLLLESRQEAAKLDLAAATERKLLEDKKEGSP